MELRRRHFLQLSAGTASGLALWSFAAAPIAWAATDFETARARRVEILNGGLLDTTDQDIAAAVLASDSKAQGYWSSLEKSASRNYLWSDLSPFDSPEKANNSLDRLRTMAIAWSAPSSSLQGNATLLADVLSGLSFWGTKYSQNSAETGNWWFWEIGMPNLLADLGVLLYPKLSAAQKSSIDGFIAKFVGNPNLRTNSPTLKETGANRTDKAHIVIRHGLIIEDSTRVSVGRDALSDTAGSGANSVFGYVSAGDGFYLDGSFVQHSKLAYVGSYGLVTIDGLADILTLLAGTPWAVTDPKVRTLYDAALANYAWFVFDAQLMDAVRGRAVSRRENTGQLAGHTLAGAIVQLASSSTEYSTQLKALVKGWLQRDNTVSPLIGNSLNRARQLKAVLSDNAVLGSTALQRHLQTPDQDRVVHHRGSWAAAFSLSSKRMGRYEWGNGENNTGWYQGDGMLQTFVSTDRRSFADNYWATSDPYHLPGVTNGLQVRENGGVSGTGIPAATQAWAGGVGWLDRLGTAGMDHKAYDGDLVAKKSWFALDDLVVALGSGITASQGQRVHSTVESRKLQTGNNQPLTVDGVVQPGNLGSVQTINNPSWAHLPNVGGYLFLQPQPLSLLRETRSGSWRTVNVNGPTDQVSDSYQTIYLDHGTNPSGASYAYALLPGASAASTQSRAAAKGFTVLANNNAVQAIAVSQNNLSMANFFAAGSAGDLSVDQPAAVVAGEQPNQFGGTDLVVTVAEPSRHGQVVNLSVNRQAGTVLEYAEKTVFSSTPNKVVMAVPTTGTRGHTQQFRFGPLGSTVKHSASGSGQNQWSYSTGWTIGSLDAYTTTTGGTATLRFTGSRVYLQSAYGPGQGLIEVSIDGQAPITVDLFGAVRNGVRVAAAFGGLNPSSSHTLLVRCLGTQNPRATGHAAALSGAVVIP
ncbi:polysaccharide lyase 8 family protein [Psychromicrobium lacuslunae]|uniref:polysaccharide lyase 8 family protein n=1 Tax=Psychromicrobium lacuslunae TaxID=1618207 RepID=UPI00069637D8|nr:polysaccharide lyase 8 family protein [Psychromicrobium lacuslunae]